MKNIFRFGIVVFLCLIALYLERIADNTTPPPRPVNLVTIQTNTVTGTNYVTVTNYVDGFRQGFYPTSTPMVFTGSVLAITNTNGKPDWWEKMWQQEPKQ